MPTDKQIEAARTNGAKSNGPVTPEGKEASSRNARKHGFSAKKFILEQEDLEEFNDLLTAYRERFRPADRVEDDLVLELAMHRFRMERVWALRVSTFDLESAKQDELLSTEVRNPDSELILSSAFTHLASTGQVDAYSRFESHFSRLYNRALRNLRQLQKDRLQNAAPEPAQSPVQNEPPAQPRLYSINELIELGHVPSLRPTSVERHKPGPIAPETAQTDPPSEPDDAAA